MNDKDRIIKEYRHNSITKFLSNVLDVDLKDAEYNAEQIENSMTDDVLTKLASFLDYIEQCTSAKTKSAQCGKNCDKSGNCGSCSCCGYCSDTK